MAAPDKRVQVKIEVGHQAACRTVKTPQGHTHDWSIFVRGAENADISHFVKKVVFLLHESFTRPKRVCKEPPYKVSETGYGSFSLPVEIYFRNKEEPRKYRLEYDLSLPLLGMPPYNFTKVELVTFLNPLEDFENRLLKGGAIILLPPSRILSSAESSRPVSKSKASPLPDSSKLVEMYKRITKLEDIDSLQSIVDIVESSGSFEITDTTFNFDLCGLGTETLDAIQQFLETCTS